MMQNLAPTIPAFIERGRRAPALLRTPEDFSDAEVTLRRSKAAALRRITDLLEAAEREIEVYRFAAPVLTARSERLGFYEWLTLGCSGDLLRSIVRISEQLDSYDADALLADLPAAMASEDDGRGDAIIQTPEGQALFERGKQRR